MTHHRPLCMKCHAKHPLTALYVQGALLLGLFNISHVVETSLSRRAQGDLASLYDQIPSTAVVVDLLPSGAPDMSTAATQPASEVLVGAHMLVRPGQQVSCPGCEQDTDISLMPALRAASVILDLQLTCHGEFAMGCVGPGRKGQEALARGAWQHGMAWHSWHGSVVCDSVSGAKLYGMDCCITKAVPLAQRPCPDACLGAAELLCTCVCHEVACKHRTTKAPCSKHSSNIEWGTKGHIQPSTLSTHIAAITWATSCQVALDGMVVYGASLVSSEHITGESIPARCEAGQALPAGARNHDGVLVVRATEASANSTPARIARLTLSAQVRAAK